MVVFCIFFVFLAKGFSGVEKYVVGLWYNFAISRYFPQSHKLYQDDHDKSESVGVNVAIFVLVMLRIE